MRSKWSDSSLINILVLSIKVICCYTKSESPFCKLFMLESIDVMEISALEKGSILKTQVLRSCYGNLKKKMEISIKK